MTNADISPSPSGPQRLHESAQERERIPRFLLQVMGGMVLASLALTIFARVTDRPLEASPPPAAILQEQAIILSGDMSGTARVFDLSGHLLVSLDPTKGGFIAGVYRSIERERAKLDLPPTLPLVLTHYADGRLAIHDPHTNWTAQLRGFGDDNFAAFMNILTLTHKHAGSAAVAPIAPDAPGVLNAPAAPGAASSSAATVDPNQSTALQARSN